MFIKTVDSEINLVLLDQSYSEPLFLLIDHNRKYLSEWMTWLNTTTSSKDVSEFIRSCLVGYASNSELACAIEYKDELVGVITFNKIISNLKKVLVGYWLSEDMQGKGIMTKCCRTMIQYAFSNLGMQKVEIHVATNNEPSIAICKRLGFHLEGTIRNSEKLNGVIVDYHYYGLMSSEYSLE